MRSRTRKPERGIEGLCNRRREDGWCPEHARTGSAPECGVPCPDSTCDGDAPGGGSSSVPVPWRVAPQPWRPALSRACAGSLRETPACLSTCMPRPAPGELSCMLLVPSLLPSSLVLSSRPSSLPSRGHHVVAAAHVPPAHRLTTTPRRRI